MNKEYEFNKKTDEELERMNDKRLLTFYKSERKKVYSKYGGIECLHDLCKESKIEYDKDWEYINSIKAVLDKRGHVE